MARFFLELHCSKYCKKIIIFYLTLSPLSLISHLCLSNLSPNLISVSPIYIAEPSTCNLAPYHAIRNSHPQPSTTEHNHSIAEPSTRNPTPYHAIRNSHPQPSTTEHSHSIAEPRTRNPAPYHTIRTAKPTRRYTTHDPRPTNSRSTTHDPQSEQCEYELVME